MASNDFGRQVCEKNCQALGYATCGGCRKWLCKKHFGEHRQELGKTISNLAEQHDELRAQVIKDENSTQMLLGRIDTWEKKSIQKIQKIAEEVRVKVKKHFHQTKESLKSSLHLLCEELRVNQIAEDFTEIELAKWTKRLQRLHQQLKRLATVRILHDEDETIEGTRFIRPNYIETSISQTSVNANTQWSKTSVTVAGNEAGGDQLNRLNDPSDIDMDDDGTLYIADTGNHRIVAWKAGATFGDVVAGGDGQGNGLNQLNQPKAVLVDRVHDSLIVSDIGNRRVMRWFLQENSPTGKVFIANTASLGLAMDDEGSLYVSDYEKHEVRRYREGDREGVVVAGGHGRGNALNQLNYPRHLFVDRDLSLYISDRDNHRVVKWAKGADEGCIVAGGHDQGSGSEQFNAPAGIFVDAVGSIYVVDSLNRRVMRWRKTEQIGQVLLGNNGQNLQTYRYAFSHVEDKRLSLKTPTGLVFDAEGNMYLSGYQSHRIERHAKV